MPGNAHAGPRLPCGGVPGSEVSLGGILKHRFFQLGLCQQLIKPPVLLFQLSQPPGFLGLNAPVLLLPAVMCRLRYLDEMANLERSLALDYQLFGGFEIDDDLLGGVHGPLHSEVPTPVGLAEDSQLP